MKKLISCGLLSLFILGLLVVPGSSQNADEILERVIKAQGGRKILESIKDVTTIADMEIIQMGITGSVTIYTKEPNRLRLDIEFMGMMVTQAFDGETAWWIGSQTGMAEDMPEEVAEVVKNSSFGNSALLDPAKYGIKYTYKGEETIEGKDYLVLDRVHSGGYTIALYIDPETYLIYKTKQDSFDEMMTEIVEETIMSDYKKVEGVMTAHVLTILRDGTEFGTLTVTDVDFNSGLEDSFFKKEE
ncbi:MAG: outer membrane lipoprotein-sorting protein [Candidatus Aminicenantes bacterium]|nr:outer membrane lipoprotein-sorting protein [Candidatus Aminicenantes bacterium]MDH5386450.1 outer membrane lipoprotein-sorting protein [Candidatus Aminicenantes bacterium]